MVNYEHLIGRPFCWGSTDCFGLARSFFSDNWGIAIRDYARPADWHNRSADLIRMLYQRENFILLAKEQVPDSELRPGDVAVMALGTSIPNHFAVFVGENRILHHKTGAMSNVETYRSFWRGYTSFFLRHPDVPDMRVKYPDVEIGDLIRAQRSFKAQDPVEGQ